ncbi:MAG: response regulator [Campylobacterales bacterium]
MKKIEDLNVLIVDDSITIRKIIAANLQKLGVTKILQAKSGDEGYQVSCSQAVDIILTDHNMSGMNGLGMVSKLRNNPKTEHIFVIAVSSEFDANLKQSYMALEVLNFIHKPFNQKEFNDAIMAYVNSSDKNGAGWERVTPSELDKLLSDGSFTVDYKEKNIELDFGGQKLLVEVKDVAEKGKMYTMLDLD